MDIRDVLQAPIEHEPRRPNAASDFLRRVADEIEVLEHHTHAEQFVRVLYAGAFGIRRAVDIQPASSDTLRIVVAESDGSQHVVISPLSQCSFMLSIVTPSAGEPREKVILGFAQPEKT